MSDYGRYGDRNNPGRPTQGRRSQGQGRASSQAGRSSSGRTSGGRNYDGSLARKREHPHSSKGRQKPSPGGRYTANSRNRIMEDERARIRARERKKRRRRQRKILFAALVLFVLLLIGGSVYGFMRYDREKKRQGLLREGIELLDKGSYEEAVARLDEALEWSKGKIGDFETNVLLYRADAEYRLKSYDAALNTYQLLCESDEENREYKKGAAQCMVQKGDYDGALALGVIDGYIYNLKAVEKIRDGAYDEALELIAKGKAAGDAGQDLAFNEAVAWENKGDFAQALKLFEAYAAQYGTDENVERELAFLRSRQGNADESNAQEMAGFEEESGAGEEEGSEGESGTGGEEGTGNEGSAETQGSSDPGEAAGEESSPESESQIQAVG